MGTDRTTPNDPTPAAGPPADPLADPLVAQLTRPRDRECLLCFVDRMLEAFGCDHTLRWARRWRDLRLPTATGLEQRLGRAGGFCDCEIFLNGWTVHPGLRLPTGFPVADGWELDGDWPTPRPPCSGVALRSSQPCRTWVQQQRPW